MNDTAFRLDMTHTLAVGRCVECGLYHARERSVSDMCCKCLEMRLNALYRELTTADARIAALKGAATKARRAR